MAIVYKVDVLNELKKNGFSTFELRKNKIIGEGTIQKFRTGELISGSSLSKVCKILKCQPGDLLEYIEDK